MKWFLECHVLVLFSIGLLGLILGSFFNVVIARLPKIIQAEESSSKIHYNLLVPRSHCPHCRKTLRWFLNIPLFSYLYLKGKCYYCQWKIPLQYPIVELLTTILFVAVTFRYGFTLKTAAGLCLVSMLIILSFIDLKHYILPDEITLPGIWLGLLFNLEFLFTSPHHAILGAVIGYLTLWSIYWIFKLLTHKDGMGYGDFKLMALLGAWFGWTALPLIILVASLLGSCWGVGLMTYKKKPKYTAIPFGPFISLAGIVQLLYAPTFILFPIL